MNRNNAKESLGSSSSRRVASSSTNIKTTGTLMLLAIAALLNAVQVPLNRYVPHSSTKNHRQQEQEDPAMQQHYTMYMYNQRRSLINESSVIDLGFNEREALPSRFLQHYFGSEIEMVESWNQVNETERNERLRDFASPTHAHADLLYGRLCDTILFFRETNGVRRHVLISHLNENWGAFSTTVPNRTVNWGEWEDHFKLDGCTTEDLWWYLNHTNVSAVFTVTHQWLDHPKVLSLPLGIKQEAAARVSQELTLQGTMGFNNRTELLLIAQSEFQHRPLIAEHVIANFNGMIRNRYHDGSDYWQNLQRAKFTLCPSGLGWDTYRAWEAIILGTIPVLETYYRTDGFYRVFDDLPVLWVDHFDNVTPSLLETSYPKILARAKEYNFAKLTKLWWVDFINSFRYDFPAEENHQMTVSSLTITNTTTGFRSLPTIDICSVSELSFNSSKMIFQVISRAYIPKSCSIAYAPFMTKCSSTTLIGGIKYSTDNAPDISSEDLSEEELRHYTFFSVLRHPLERALAGIHQVEVFWKMNWIGGPISKFNLTWWDKTCLNSTSWREEGSKYPCRGSHHQTTTERRLQRLNDFLDEVEEKGYWDQHIAPMTYLIATNKFSVRLSYFDIAHVDNLTNIMAQSVGKEVKSAKPKMARKDGFDWAFKWKELVSLVPQHNLARSAVTKLCRLYQHDVECLPYDVPECRSIR